MRLRDVARGLPGGCPRCRAPGTFVRQIVLARSAQAPKSEVISSRDKLKLDEMLERFQMADTDG